MTQTLVKSYSVKEEIAHAVIHGLGVILSIAALVIMVAQSSLYGDHWHIVSSIIYGASLIILYTTSTLYHSIPDPVAKVVLRRLCLR